MNYALKTLMKQSEVIVSAINRIQKQYDEFDIELAADIEFYTNDLENLKTQNTDLIEAIIILKTVLK